MTPVSTAARNSLIQSIRRSGAAPGVRQFFSRPSDFRRSSAAASSSFLRSSTPSPAAWQPRPVLAPDDSRDLAFASPLWRRFSAVVSLDESSPQPSDEIGVTGTSSRPTVGPPVRLSKLIASHGLNMQMSRRSAERLIEDGMVTVAGKVVEEKGFMLTLEEAAAGGGIVKVTGRLLRLPTPGGASSPTNGASAVNGQAVAPSAPGGDGMTEASATPVAAPTTRIWLAHKLTGEVVADDDPYGRPSLMQRLRIGGVGKSNKKKSRRGDSGVHLKPVGRLDMMTEGLIVVTNDGRYAREMELPSNGLHRTYRARVHGRITSQKLKAIRSGCEVNNVKYRGMKVNIEAATGGMRRRERATNTWLRITCVEGKNRQIRKVLEHLGLTVTRLIRTSFGDYDLFTIPPGLAIEVPVKPVEGQKKRGSLQQKWKRQKRQKAVEVGGEMVQPVEWIRHV